MPDSDSRIHWELSEQIIGAGMAVLNELGPGLDEKLYENALMIDLSERGIRIDQQRQYPVHYHGRFIGKLIPDLIVAEKVIVDAKIAETFCDAHMAQMLGYLKITNLQLGLLLNFKFASLEWKRVVRTKDAGRNSGLSLASSTKEIISTEQ